MDMKIAILSIFILLFLIVLMERDKEFWNSCHDIRDTRLRPLLLPVWLLHKALELFYRH